MKTTFQTILFDLDGTLVDHFQTIYRCYAYALDRLNLPPVTYDQVRAAVGGSIPITFGKLIPQQHVELAVELYREHFHQIWSEGIQVLPGTVALLQALHASGRTLAVFTNKEGEWSRKIMQAIHCDAYLTANFGLLDTPWRKPQPELTRHVLGQLQAQPETTLFIGDSPYDAAAAAAGNISCALVATGSHSMDELRAETEAVRIYPDLATLAKQEFPDLALPVAG